MIEEFNNNRLVTCEAEGREIEFVADTAYMRKALSRATLIAILMTTFFVLNPEAHAEECPIYDFPNLFSSEYYPDTKWNNVSGNRDITWSANAPVILDEPIVRNFSPEEMAWLQAAFQSWDDALETLSFTQVAYTRKTDVIVGFVAFTSAPNQPNAFSYWDGWWSGNWRDKATIKLSIGQSLWFTAKNKFIHAIQHEVGNVLGLGDIIPSEKFTSTLEDQWRPPYGNIPLSNFDIGMVRQLYGESTCPSTFSVSTPKVPATKIVSIFCARGNVMKTVFGVEPKCPKGFKKN